MLGYLGYHNQIGLEVPEKFVWGVGWGGGGGGLQSYFRVKPNRCVVLRLGLGLGF